MSSDDYFLKLKRNQVIMIRNRGYDISDEEWILDSNLTSKQFRKKLMKKYEKDEDYPIRKLMFSEYTHPKKDKSLFIYYVCIDGGGKQIKVETVKSFLYKLTEENKDGLLVIDTTLSPTASDCFNTITEHHYQIFKEEDLLFNIINHVQCNQHVLCSDEEVLELKKKGIGNKGLPWILRTDAIVQYYDFPVGSFVKIIVDLDISVLNNTMCHFRVVV